MNKKMTLSMMELLMMVLVFSLCTALSMQAFATSHRISQDQNLRETAAILAQNEAESIKAQGGITEGYTREENGFSISVSPAETDLPTLGKAVINVSSENTSFTLNVSWQEVAYES